MILNRLSDGPSQILSPPQEHAFAQLPSQSLLSQPGHFNSYPASAGSLFANSDSTKPTSSTSFASSSIAPKPSRKRSRDQFVEEVPICNVPIRPTTVTKEKPIYGEGITLLNPQTGIALSAKNQSGTWFEETTKSQAVPASSLSTTNHSDAADISRKAQRLDNSAPGLDEIALASMTQRLDGPDMDQHRTINGASTPPTEPLVDDATLLLGISWQRIDMDGDMAPAVRGWIKYIDNQYSAHLRNSQMLMKSRALNAYLVAATPISSSAPAFYLFSEDLTQAQCVASSWEACLHNLRNTPILFEGAPLTAACLSSAQQIPNLFTSNVDAGVPLLQQAISSHSHLPNSTLGLNGSVGMGMEIDS
ncbi:hypothetical protein N7495_008205 [Penicillium taxi]|uniref:uncharacterized protein n=1 Tax=Penicillium taxi TaxID=168475 RepID=UPI0025451362|nr:uncharacterized protein N7495_008205 [Penicillium taxi]KAJ5888164.1 hypothetical protein N7495_008205 [Penicillium taxi]